MPTSTAASDKARLFEILKKNAFFREKITLSSGKESDYYIDARRVTLSAEGAYFCAKIILDTVKNETYDAIGGPTLGADPLVGALAVLSYQDGRPVKTFIIRKAPKAHGKQQQIEGPLLPEGSRVVLIDDVATTGKAFLESLEVLKKSNIRPVKAVCIVDRGEGAKDALAKQGLPLVSIFIADDFLKS
ncbi:MAG: orotate phosphoribosyltransferase [Candidatus Omnitrophota bacterium]|nr:orotate phosphoribosyltransferase [Candidatus Omnitrophota bacterium]MDZ4243438.1 orotate phosphoribosyltransferase [Candidatus Omnitrophota bacterium]